MEKNEKKSFSETTIQSLMPRPSIVVKLIMEMKIRLKELKEMILKICKNQQANKGIQKKTVLVTPKQTVQGYMSMLVDGLNSCKIATSMQN